MESKTKLLIFKIVAWYAAVYHLILGLVATFGPENLVIRTAESVYRITVSPGAQFFYQTKFVGAYMLAFGLMLAFMAYDPKRYSAFVWPAVLLFGVRIFDRLVFFRLLNEAFGSTMGQNLVTVAIAAVIGLLLLLFRPTQSDG